MVESIKKSISIYSLYFKEIFYIGLLFTLPIQIIYTFFINYVTAPFQYFGIPIWTSLIQLLFILIIFPIIQLPYISILKYDMFEDDISMKMIVDDFFQKGFHVYLLAIICSILSVIGFLFFIIPGLLLMIFFLYVPQATLLNHVKWGSALKKSLLMGRTSFFPLLITIITFVAIDSLVSGFVFFISVGLTNSFFAVNLLLIIINTFLLPLFIFTISNIYISKEVNNDSSDKFINDYVLKEDHL